MNGMVAAAAEMIGESNVHVAAYRLLHSWNMSGTCCFKVCAPYTWMLQWKMTTECVEIIEAMQKGLNR